MPKSVTVLQREAQRRARQAAALRANLVRRKSQDKGASAGMAADPTETARVDNPASVTTEADMGAKSPTVKGRPCVA